MEQSVKRNKIKNIFRYIVYELNRNNTADYDYVEFEKEFAIILTLFLKNQNLNKEEIIEKIYARLEFFIHKMGFINSFFHLKKTVNNYFEKDKISNITFRNIAGSDTKYKLFVLYSLIQFSSSDNLYSLKEEEFIDYVREKIKLPKITLEKIIEQYSKKGLKEERKIIEEQNRKKLMKQFSRFMLPYEAYRIMGVSPSVTKVQLKKAYRALAKKYHPDKFAGKSDAEIQKAEDKFQEIKEAYDVILKSKKWQVT